MNIAIVGFAHGHYGAYCRQWAAHPEWDVIPTKGWDHDIARLTQNAQNLKLDAVEKLDDLIRDTSIDAFLITAETSLHADLVEAIAPAKKPIALQKPMALTIKEADRIINAVEENHTPFTMLWQMRCDPQNLWMKKFMESGILGQVFQFRRRHNLGLCLNPANANIWHCIPELNRDIWADDCAHPADLIYWLFGMPKSVTAEIETLYNPQMPHDNGVVIFRYPEKKLIAEVACSFTASSAEVTTEIYAEKGTVVQRYGDAVTASMPRDPDAVGMKYYLTNDQKWYDCTQWPSPNSQAVRIGGLAQPMAEFFHGQRKPICTAFEGRESLKMIIASLISSVEGRRVYMDDPQIANFPLPLKRGLL